jgi:hypothetical protein
MSNYCLDELSGVGIASGYGLDDGVTRVRVPVEVRFSPLHIVQIGFKAHRASYLMGTGGFFSEGKETGA